MDALWKLGGELAEEGPAPAVASVAVAALPGADHLAVLFGAISARRPVGVRLPRAGRRRLDPYRLSFRNGHWYLAGLDHGAGDERSFRLDRVESEVTASGEAASFPPPPAAAAAAPAVGDGGGEPVRRPAAGRRRPGRVGGRARRGRGGRGAAARRLGGAAPCRSPTGPPSGRSSSASSTTPRCSARPSCGPRWSSGWRPGQTDVPRLSADDRLQRLLALVPWVAARDGPRLADVCARFGCSEDELVDDLQLLFLCGLHPYTPDMLIDVDIADGRVWIRYADYFARPLRLTPAEGLGLLAAGRTLLATPGADPTGPLARGLAKLAGALGVDVDEAVEISLGSAPEGVMAVLREAVAAVPPGRDRVLRLRPRRVDEAHRRPVHRLLRRRPVVRVGLVPPGRRRAALPRRPHPDGHPARDRLLAARRAPGAGRLPAPARRPPGRRSSWSRRPRWVVEQYPVERVEPVEDGGGPGPGHPGGQPAGVAGAAAPASRARRPGWSTATTRWPEPPPAASWGATGTGVA